MIFYFLLNLNINIYVIFAFYGGDNGDVLGYRIIIFQSCYTFNTIHIIMSENEKTDAAPQDDGKQVVPAEGANAGELDVSKKGFT